MSTPKKILFGWLALSLIVIVIDQITKWMVVTSIPFHGTVPIMPMFNLTHVYNPGAAFSFLANAGGWQRHFFSALAVIASIVIIGMLRKSQDDKLLSLALSLILGGAIGNLIDRIWLGHVIDFIQVYWQNSYFPAFNVADSAITVGAGLMIWDSLFGKKSARHASKTEESVG